MRTLCILLLASAALFAQASLDLSGIPGLAPAGTTVTVTISLTLGGGPAGLQWDMTGLPAGATFASLVTGKTIQCSATRCILSGLNATAIADGPVATIQYAQPATPPSEALTATLAASPAGAAVTTTAGGIVSRCDLSGDGKIDATDVGLAVTQALASTTGTPTILDVIRVIIAAFGGACLR